MSSATIAAAVRCEHLTVRFGGLLAVNDLSFSVEEGTIHGLIGPNGAGKTTIFNAVSGFCAPTSGRIIYQGRDIAGMKMHAVATLGIARTFQHSSLFHKMTVLENVLVGCHLRQGSSIFRFLLGAASGRQRRIAEEKAEAILDFVGLRERAYEYAENLPHGLQRIAGIAAALSTQPRVLLLDEPFTGMNAEETRRMMDLTRKINRNGVTVLLVEHDMRAVMGLCKKITAVYFGRLLAEGTPDEISAHPGVIDAYLGRSRHAA